MISGRRKPDRAGRRAWRAAGWIALALAISAGAGLLWRQRSRGREHGRTAAVKRTLKMLHDSHATLIDNSFRQEGLDADALLSAPAESAIWSSAIQQRTQRVINQNFKPVPEIRGQFVPILPQSTAFVTVLPEEKAALETAAASVGRIEQVAPDGAISLLGTAFVIGDAAVATNCHVIATEAGEVLSVPQTVLRVDFGETAEHLAAKEFAVTSILPCGTRTGFDIAFLSVQRSSIDQSGRLPPALSLARNAPDEKLRSAWINESRRIWLIGYPNLANASEPLYKKLHVLSPNAAKIFTPGVTQDLVKPKGFDVILHDGSSDSGNSGSPLLDLAAKQIIGVDHCCYDGIVRKPKEPLAFPCAFVFGQAGFNESIASWEVWADPVLGPQLKQIAHLP